MVKNLLSWAAIIISLGTLLWTFHFDSKLLPLSESKVIFSESDIKVYPILKEGERGEKLILTIENIGRVEAQNIRFRVYALHFSNYIKFLLKSGGGITSCFGQGIDNDLKCSNFQDFKDKNGKNSYDVIEFYADKIINNLQPSAKINRLALEFPHFITGINTITGKKFKDELKEEKLVLILQLNYTDSIGGNKENISFFLHQLNSEEVVSLIGIEYKEVYCRMLKGFDNDYVNNKSILKYLKKNKPDNIQKCE